MIEMISIVLLVDIVPIVRATHSTAVRLTETVCPLPAACARLGKTHLIWTHLKGAVSC
jgi:hypothetical protein